MSLSHLVVLFCLISSSFAVDPLDESFEAVLFATDQSTSTSCSKTSGSCSTASGNSVTRSFTYSNETGKFTGYIISNGCPDYSPPPIAQAKCTKNPIPDSHYSSSSPKAAPLRGQVGWGINGVNIYGPFDAGFSTGFACSGGYCTAGTDIDACVVQLEATCTGSLDYNLFLDSCGGHANPYHYHQDPACVYSGSTNASHSPLVGFALDGYGIYGMFEGNGAKPTDLDTCNGHYGLVPNSSLSGAETTSSVVYHYHTTTLPPYTVGCYGPATLAQCKALYSGCSSITNLAGVGKYSLDCPCFYQVSGVAYNYNASDYSASYRVSSSSFLLVALSMASIIFMML